MYFDILLFSHFLQCIFSVGLYYKHIGKDVHMTCKTNDPDPSFKIEKWRMTKVFGGNHPFLHLWASCLKTNQYQSLFSVKDLSPRTRSYHTEINLTTD
jgi:hypothetical protein